MEKLIRESEYFLAWLVFWLCATVVGLIGGFVVGFIIGFILGASGVDLQSIRPICAGAGYIIGTVLSYIVFRFVVEAMIVKKAQGRLHGE